MANSTSEMFKLRTLEDCLKNVPEADLKELKTHIFGRGDDNAMPITKEGQALAKANNFVIQTYKIDAIKEEFRKPRIVRIGAVQHSLAVQAYEPLQVQREKGFDKVAKLIEAAAAENVNVLCLQELWSELETKIDVCIRKLIIVQ